MKTPRVARLALVALLAIIATLALADASGAAVPVGGGVNILAQNGFGDHNNSFAWSMGWFKGRLYVGTGRDELCLEEQTLDFYFPLLDQYSTSPGPGVRCAANPYDLDLRAEIWQYTPSTGLWAQVYRSPATERNPRARGKTVASDIAFRGMTVMTDPHGRQALFAAGVTADEYLPPLLRSHPPRILRSYDGVHWTSLGLPSVVSHAFNGNFRPMGFRSLLVFKNRLFVAATPDLTGDGQLFEVTNPFSDHAGLRQVSPRNLDIFEIEKFGGKLYVGTGNPDVRLRGVAHKRQRPRPVPLHTGRNERRRPWPRHHLGCLDEGLPEPALRWGKRLVQQEHDPGLGDDPDRSQWELDTGGRQPAHAAQRAHRQPHKRDVRRVLQPVRSTLLADGGSERRAVRHDQ